MEAKNIFKSFSLLILTCAIISMAGSIVFLSGISRGYDTTAFSYMICTFIMMIAVIKYDLLEVLVAVNDYATDNIYAGLIAVSNDGQIIYRNDPAVKICHSITEEYQHAEKIERMALTDAMTEFGNRRSYEIKITELQEYGIPDGTFYISFGAVSKIEYADMTILELAKIADMRMYEAI